MNIAESIAMAWDSVRAHKLRSAFTLLSVSIGVFAIVASSGITSALNIALGSQLADLGEHSFLIQRTPSLSFGTNWRKYAKRKPISYEQALTFRDKMTLTNLITISNTAPGYVIKSGSESTDPDVAVIGVDDLYFNVNAVSISAGRAFTEQDVHLNSTAAIIGNDVVVKLFPNVDPIGQTIVITSRETKLNQRLTVVGLLEKKGGLLGQSQDNRVLIPINLFVKYYTMWWDVSVDVSVKAFSRDALPATVDEATGIMRMIREVKPGEENNFEIDTNEALTSQFANLSVAISALAWISGLIALVVAGIGIMNMMLVSVKERTREIGVRKALGARRSWILQQFLVEGIAIGQFGAVAGVVLGSLATLGVTYLIKSNGMESISYSLPWFAIVFSVLSCTVIGLLSGIYPAYRAASLDPIEALRYE